MENRNKYASIIILVSLMWITTALKSYAENEDSDKDNEITLEQQDTLTMLSKVKKEEARVYGGGGLGIAHSIDGSYSEKTSFTPSLIITKKADKKKVSNLALSASMELGLEKKIFFQDIEMVKGQIEFLVKNCSNKKEILLTKLCFDVGKTYGTFTCGITDTKFANIAVSLPVRAMQVSWAKDIHPSLAIGIGIEQAEDFSFLSTDAKGKKDAEKDNLQPKKYLPAGSGQIQYKLPNKLGSIELSGLFRPLVWVNTADDQTKFLPGCGVNLGTKINVKPKTDTFTANLIFGQGIGEYISDIGALDNQPISIFYVVKNKSKEIKMMVAGGAYASYKYYWTPSLHSTIGGGITKVWHDNTTDKPDFYDLGAYGTGNLVYWFTEHTSVGFAYGAGLRNNADHSKQDSKFAQQIKAMVEFKL